MSAFLTLSLSPSLTLSEEEIKKAYENTHRGEKELAARNTLLSPANRLAEWMVSVGLPLSKHASLPEQILPLFSEMVTVVEKVSSLSRKKTESKSVLAETLLMRELLLEKEHLDALSMKINTLEEDILSSFPTLERTPHEEAANHALQSLKYIKKWKAELNHAYGKLF